MRSYSSLIKENLLTIEKYDAIHKDCCWKTNLFCFLSFKSYSLGDNNKVEIKVEEVYLAKFVNQILKRVKIEYTREKYNTSTGREIYRFIIESSFVLKNSKKLEEIPHKKCCRFNWLKVAFLCSGYLSDPAKNYHLEFCSSFLDNIEKLKTLLKEEGLEPKYYKKGGDSGNYVLYLKKSDDIIHFLAIIGANKLLIDIESMRIEKELRNKVTRQVNYETANLEKTIESSVKHIDAIEWYRQNGPFNELPESLKEVAMIRIENPDKNLRELCDLFPKPITKSGINHRLRRLYGIIQREKINQDI